MRLPSFPVLILFLLHSVEFASAHWDRYGEIPAPTPAPLLDRDDRFKDGSVLMETNLGYERNGTAKRNLALGERQVCDRPGPQG
jgi:hypothetical protein